MMIVTQQNWCRLDCNVVSTTLIEDGAWKAQEKGGFDRDYELINSGFDANSKDVFGDTALILSSRSGNVNLTSFPHI